ncbi:MAG TPA: AmmeMemoRadiSam system protein B [Fluviicoccus sp.]|nr:AmmeMemoRadiSam system protein B [Fluviicoccus sp.]
MLQIREPAVAGRFYPADPAELRAALQACFDRAGPARTGAPCPRALIAPHAGYPYSGVAAASAFATLREHRALVWRVVLLGPSHQTAFKGLALSRAETYRTPLGDIPLDAAATRRLLALPGVHLLEAAHLYEHSLEVQLPFLQTVLGEFMLLPVVVGDAEPAQVEAVLETFGDDEGTLFVISSDLSHYLDDAAAKRLDSLTRDAVEHLDAAAIGDRQACGRVAVKGLLDFAARRHWKPETLALCNSGDSDAGNRERVVGYGAWVFYRETPKPDRLSTSERDTLKSIAWASIRQGLAGGGPLAVRPEVYPPRLSANGAVFVTLLKDGDLRGCIGSLEARRPLVEDVSHHAWDAAFNDARFTPLQPDELEGLTMHISMLVPPEALEVHSEEELVNRLRPGIDGVILEEGHRRATYLPSVWSQIPDPVRFVRYLKRKGGWPERYWSPGLRVWRYEVEEF